MTTPSSQDPYDPSRSGGEPPRWQGGAGYGGQGQQSGGATSVGPSSYGGQDAGPGPGQAGGQGFGQGAAPGYDAAPAYGSQPGYGETPAYGSQPGYGAPAYAERAVGERPRNSLGIAALILGVLAVIFSWTVIAGVVLGLLAIVFGIVALRRVRRGGATGRALPIIGLVTGALGIILAGVLVAVGVTFLRSDASQRFQECLRQAGTNQAAQQACNRELQENLQR